MKKCNNYSGNAQITKKIKQDIFLIMQQTMYQQERSSASKNEVRSTKNHFLNLYNSKNTHEIYKIG